MGIKILRLRHKTSPMPEGCRWCGTGARIHARQWVPSKKWHTYEAPTAAQITARARARRNALRYPELIRLPEPK